MERPIDCYRIGEFSKMVNVPISTLRYYDEINILKPGYVDCFSGYRYYTAVNFEEVKSIALMRELGFSLEEILLYKDNMTEEVLEEKIEELSKEREELDLKIITLNKWRSNLEALELNTAVKVLKLENCDVA